jgi:hypothetical protein
MEKVIPNYHIIKIKYLGFTNTKNSRIKLTSELFKQSLTLPNDSNDIILNIAINYLTKNNFDIIGQGESKEGFYIISNTFEPLKPFIQN